MTMDLSRIAQKLTEEELAHLAEKVKSKLKKPKDEEGVVDHNTVETVGGDQDAPSDNPGNNPEGEQGLANAQVPPDGMVILMDEGAEGQSPAPASPPQSQQVPDEGVAETPDEGVEETDVEVESGVEETPEDGAGEQVEEGESDGEAPDNFLTDLLQGDAETDTEGEPVEEGAEGEPAEEGEAEGEPVEEVVEGEPVDEGVEETPEGESEGGEASDSFLTDLLQGDAETDTEVESDVEEGTEGEPASEEEAPAESAPEEEPEVEGEGEEAPVPTDENESESGTGENPVVTENKPLPLDNEPTSEPAEEGAEEPGAETDAEDGADDDGSEDESDGEEESDDEDGEDEEDDEDGDVPEESDVEETVTPKTPKEQVLSSMAKRVARAAIVASMSMRIALEFDTRKEYEQYKKEKKIKPGTKVKILEEGRDKSKLKDKAGFKPTGKPGEQEPKDKGPKVPEDKPEGKPGEQPTEGKPAEKAPADKPGEQGQAPTPAPQKTPSLKFPSSSHGEAARQVAIKDSLIEQFGKDAAGWNAHNLHPSQMTSGVAIRFPDGSTKKYGELSPEEKARVDKAVSSGMTAHKGMNDYSHVGVAALRQNQANNLALYDDKSVQETKNESQEPATKENAAEVASSISHNARSVVHKYAKAMSGLSRPMLEKHVDHMTKAITEGLADGSLAGIKQADLDDMVREDVKRLIHQEVETRRRSLEDHGIRHATSNADSSMKMMDELKAGGIPVTGKDKLMALTVQANHDTGYTLGEPATNARAKGHQQNSAVVAGEEADRYSKVFGADGAAKIKDTILTHDQNKIDWEKDPMGSAVRMADISALFGKDKVQDLFIRSPRAMDVVCRMKLALDAAPDDEELHGKLKKQLHSVVDEESFDPLDKEMMHRQVDEMTSSKDSEAFTAKDILSRYSGRLDGFKFDPAKKVMSVNMSYSPEGQMVDQMFGSELAAKKFGSFAGDLGVEVPDGKKPNQMTFGGAKPVVSLNIANMDDGVEQTATTQAMKDFAENTARTGLQGARKALTPPPGSDINAAKKHINDQRHKFDSGEWAQMEKLFAESGDDVKKLSDGLARFPMLKSERAYLMSAVGGSPATEVAARVARSFLVDKLTGSVACWFLAARGVQVNRKDKDLMSDTGGGSKRPEKESEFKPPREDNKHRFRKHNKPAEQRDPDTDNDRDKE